MHTPRRASFANLLLLLSLAFAVALGCDGKDGLPGPAGPAGPAGPPGEQGPPGDVTDSTAAVEGCIGCHAVNAAVPVGDITNIVDAHFVDTDPFGPLTASGYRQLEVVVDTVDVTGMSAVMDFTVSDITSGGSAPVPNILPSDGRFTLARLVAGSGGDPSAWQRVVNGERFTSSGGNFENRGGGVYRYTSVFDPMSVPLVMGETFRLGMQIAASDLPPGNGWCDFDVDLAMTNVCDPPMVTLTRDIVQTAVCNDCHGTTPDTMLDFHSGRTDVEYCVTCHNPDIGDTDMTPLIHKLHAGAQLSNGFRGFGNRFTAELDDCSSCHTGGGADETNWYTQPNRVSCGSCHDNVDFDTGAGHGMGGIQMTNAFCVNCHPADGTITPGLLPVRSSHKGEARLAEAGLYRGTGNGYSIDVANWDSANDQITIDYSVTRNGTRAILQSDPEWTSGSSSLSLRLAWPTTDYKNTFSGSTPAQPVRFDALDVGGIVMDLGGGSYRIVADVPSDAYGTATIGMEGHPAADLRDDGVVSFSDSIPVRSVFRDVNIEPRAGEVNRRDIIDIDKCNACHDSGGAGLTLHGRNRVGEMVVCAECHNDDATDINQRPADPSTTPDGKREESIDIKRMVHQIHTGRLTDSQNGQRLLENGIVYYGFRGSVHDFSEVNYIGNLVNCEGCHLTDTYSTEASTMVEPSTIDTGADAEDPADDLNISRVASVCASCHDNQIARDHMLLNGASFQALEENIR